MTIIDGGNGGDDLAQLWAVITELSEQLNQNRSLSVSLYALTGNVKNQAVHSQTGFVLRRFNTDKTKEAYENELERMNAGMAAENQTLQHDNKQLNTLIKEYEQTLDTLMSNFRNRAQLVQENELNLVRQYESKLLLLEEENSSRELETSTRISESISRMSEVLRRCLRELGGERVFNNQEDASISAPSDGASTSLGGIQDRRISTRPDVEDDPDLIEREPWLAGGAAQAEWALEREIELVRLEKENEELRRLVYGEMGVTSQPRPQQQIQGVNHLQVQRGSLSNGIPRPAGEPGMSEGSLDRDHEQLPERSSGSPPEYESDKERVERSLSSDVGPYGTVKRTKSSG